MPATASDQRTAYRRHVAVLYADLSDSTAITTSLEPEVYAALYADLLQIWTTAVERHGGDLVQVRGDGILAVFGLDGDEHSVRRALDAVLDVHAGVRAHPGIREAGSERRLSMHSGVAMSPVLVLQGDRVQGRYVLIGAAPNMAARLSDEATADKILVAAAALGRERRYYRLGEPHVVHMKGLGPVPVVSVVSLDEAERHGETPSRRWQLPLFGRDRELSHLHIAAVAVRGGRFERLAIAGPAGIGKTRLIEEFLAGLDAGWLVLRGGCDSYFGSESLQPLRQMLRDACRADASLEALLDHWSVARDPHAETVQSLLGRDSDPTTPLRLEAVVSLLRALGAVRPLALFIDDWQWADDATRRVVGSLTVDQAAGVFLLLTTRDLVVDQVAGTDVLELTPLGTADCSAIIDEMTPDVDVAHRAWLCDSAGGNPLYLEELCNALARAPTAHAASPQERAPSIEGLIDSRLPALPPAQLEVLRAAAVIGDRVPLSWLQAMVGSVANDATLQALERADFLDVDATRAVASFRHGLARRVVRESLTRDVRVAMHLACARAIETLHGPQARTLHVEALAHHLCEAGADEEGSVLAQLAGDRALAGGTLDRARSHYLAALAALDRLCMTDAVYARWQRVSQTLAMACLYDARREHLGIFARAAALAATRGHVVDQAIAEYWRAYILYALGEPLRAVTACRHAQALAVGRARPSLVDQIEATLGQALASAGQNDEARQLLDRTIAVKRNFHGKAHTPQAFAYILAARGMMLADIGLFAEAQADFDEADRVIGNSGHDVAMSTTSLQAGMYLLRGDWSSAIAAYARTTALAERCGSNYMKAIATSLGGFARWNLDHSQQALDDLVRGTKWLEAQHEVIWTGLNYGWLTSVMVELGRFGEARIYAARALRRGRRGEQIGIAFALCALAQIPSARARRPVVPERRFAMAMAAADARGSRRERAVVRFERARYLAAQNDPALAQEAVADSLLSEREFVDMGMTWHAERARALRARSATETARTPG